MEDSLAPGFLVASPALRCPFFERSLVLLIDHSEEGSFGFVVNKRTKLSMKEVLDEVGVEVHGLGVVNTPVLLGGPVASETGWLLYDAQNTEPPKSGQTIVIDDHIACSASLELLKRLAEGDGLSDSFMVLGYAGWGSGQLEAEMKQGSWIPVDLEHELVFDTPVEARWSAALATLGIDLSTNSYGVKVAEA